MSLFVIAFDVHVFGRVPVRVTAAHGYGFLGKGWTMRRHDAPFHLDSYVAITRTTLLNTVQVQGEVLHKDNIQLVLFIVTTESPT